MNDQDSTERGVRGVWIQVQPKPRAIQHEGACDHHNFRKLRGLHRRRRCLLHWSNYCDEGLLQAESQLPLWLPYCPHYPGRTYQHKIEKENRFAICCESFVVFFVKGVICTLPPEIS